MSRCACALARPVGWSSVACRSRRAVRRSYGLDTDACPSLAAPGVHRLPSPSPVPAVVTLTRRWSWPRPRWIKIAGQRNLRRDRTRTQNA